MAPELEAECVQEAQARAIPLPSDWSVQELVDELGEAMLDVNPAVLKAAASLRDHGAYACKQHLGMSEPNASLCAHVVTYPSIL